MQLKDRAIRASRLVIALFTASILFSQANGNEKARKSAEDWLDLVDSGQYAESWKQAAKLFRSQVAEQRWIAMIEGVRSQTGKLKDRTLQTTQTTKELPNAPPGNYALLQYRATFDAGPFTETVVLVEEPQVNWKVAGYFVKPPK